MVRIFTWADTFVPDGYFGNWPLIFQRVIPWSHRIEKPPPPSPSPSTPYLSHMAYPLRKVSMNYRFLKDLHHSGVHQFYRGQEFHPSATVPVIPHSRRKYNHDQTDRSCCSMYSAVGFSHPTKAYLHRRISIECSNLHWVGVPSEDSAF